MLDKAGEIWLHRWCFDSIDDVGMLEVADDSLKHEMDGGGDGQGDGDYDSVDVEFAWS